uniref:Odorant receptor n=1 Tax=Semiothisa cinerearia TaxID=2249628 RepID=A0A889XL88_9NEOP|nr:odorant receptor [Semiothisa cinerearia]
MHDDASAGASVRAHVRLLRACGFLRARDAGARGAVYRALALAVTATYLLQECACAWAARTDMDELARVMFLLLCHVTSLAKQLVFCADADRIDALLASLEGPMFAGGSERARALLAARARVSSRFVRCYSGTAVVTCTLWAVFPVLQALRGEAVRFPFWVGFDYSSWPRFSLVLLYSYYVTTLVGIANTTMDAFIATVLSQCKTQLTILRMNLEDLPERALVAARRERDGARAACASERDGACGRYHRWLDTLFLECLAHYDQICQTAHTLQDIFGGAILIQFGIGGWILCMAAYKIVSLRVLSGEFASMTLFICCILTELFLYCYYGNEMSVESARVVQAAYCMRWARTPARFRRALLVLMERARRPLRPAAGRVVPLSLDTFLKIIKSSYTFYAVLRQTK